MTKPNMINEVIIQSYNAESAVSLVTSSGLISGKPILNREDFGDMKGVEQIFDNFMVAAQDSETVMSPDSSEYIILKDVNIIRFGNNTVTVPFLVVQLSNVTGATMGAFNTNVSHK